VLIVLAVLVAVATNVDAVGLSRQLWRNPAGRAALVAQATAASQPPTTTPGAPGSSAESPPDAGLAELQRQCEAAGPGTDDTIDSPEDAARALSGIRHCIADAVGAQSGLDVIDGAAWISPSEWWHRWSPSSSRAWWLHLVGVALTAAALVLGAPFWFDIGKRLTGARRGLVGQA